MALLLLILFSAARSQEVSTPATQLGPRDYNYHAYRFLEDSPPEPTKEGPVLFPNDGPPSPPTPLIVTARPLIESIPRSELNPARELNNSIASSSQIRQEFRLKPGFRLKSEYRQPSYLKSLLARVKDYRPIVLATPTPVAYVTYDDVKKSVLDDLSGNGYGDYETQTPLPPIYRVLAERAKEGVLIHKHKPLAPAYQYQVKERDYSDRYQHNDVRDDGEADYDHASNYAFSYTVKDHKTGDDFSHSQHSTGSSTNGEYRVRLPDGRMQIVSYTADHNGYKADVRYDDEDKTSGNRIDRENHDYKQKPDYRNTFDYGHENDYSKHEYDEHYSPNKGHDYKSNYDESHYNPNKEHDFKSNYDERHYSPNKEHEFKSNPYDYAVSSDYKPSAKETYSPYSDLSKEDYNNEYSLEYDGKDDNYAPHRSKFSAFVPKSTLGTIVVPTGRKSVSSTVRPTYEDLKPLFVNKNIYNGQPTQEYYKNVEFNVPSTTPSSFDQTTEHVVVIGGSKPNLYTNVRNVPLTPTPPVVTTSNYVTPRNYLVSTIASLAKGQKPVLSDSFINRINKYLTFT